MSGEREAYKQVACSLYVRLGFLTRGWKSLPRAVLMCLQIRGLEQLPDRGHLEGA